MSDERTNEADALPAGAEAAPEGYATHAGGGIAVQCQFCAGRNFRRSRWRKGDFRQLLLMRYPVRCLRCSQRQWVSFSVASISIPSHVKHVPERVVAARRDAGSGSRKSSR